ncbi:MAG: hypothetical protein Q9N68_13925 [Gammaproteobacteria bacterium]|nr:hypothetical protein [Gammaproteobacteria bacterium]
MFKKTVMILSMLSSFTVGAEQDTRLHVDFPPMMQEHMMSNMRDHLVTLQSITLQLSLQNYDAAAEAAEQRLGMSSLDDHGAAHMGKMMPKEMGAIGTRMHRAASRFALVAKDAAVKGDSNKVFAALSEIMTQCVACHAAYKIH